MKRICFVTTVPMTVRAFVLPMVQYFLENTDWDITVVCDHDPTLAEELPERVHYVPISMKRGVDWRGLASVKHMYQLFSSEKFDLVQYSTPNAALYASIASRMAGIKHRKYHLMGFRYLGFTGIRKTIFKWIERFCCALSTDIECVSESNMCLGVSEKIFPRQKAHVVFHGSSAGIDLTRFDIRRKEVWRKELRGDLAIHDNACVFGFAGRITGDKGINELLEAFETLAPGENRLLLIGTLEHTGLDPALLSRGQQNPGIRILPFVDDIERYYSAMDVLVLPSYREGFGNIVIEAQAMGIPVIVTHIPGPVDAMIPGETGLTVPVADSKALASAMEQLSRNPALRVRMGTKGRQMVEMRYDSNVLLAHYLQERKTLLNGSYV